MSTEEIEINDSFLCAIAVRMNAKIVAEAVIAKDTKEEPLGA
jgi:hypothetical protein